MNRDVFSGHTARHAPSSRTGRGRTLIMFASMLLLASSAGAVALAGSGSLPPIPGIQRERQFADAPATWRDHLIEVRAVQQIEDPLARCLAWPDLPGNAWPEGHAKAHCDYHFSPVPSPAEVDAHFSAGRLAELEALLAERFAGHARAQQPDESVHRFTLGFETLARSDASEADRISRDWLESSPDSAFATLARATVLETRGWTARGGRWARDTSRGQFAEMRAFFEQAAPLYQRTLELDPGLTDAHIGLISIAKSGHRGVDAEAVVGEAQHVAPGCAEVALELMSALQPRWGGSYEAMAAFAQALEPEVAASPLIANQIAAPFVDAIDVMHREGRYSAETATVIDDILAISSNEEMLSLAAAANFNRTDGSNIDYAKAVVYLLQRLRFNTLDPWQTRKLAWYFVRRDPEWARVLLIDAVTRDPDSAHGHYYLGAASHNSGHFEQAEHHYVIASDDADVGHAALRELVEMWMLNAGLADEAAARRAAPHLDRLLQHYPDDGRAHLFDLLRTAKLQGSMEIAQLERWLAIADRDDPLQLRFVESFNKSLGK